MKKSKKTKLTPEKAMEQFQPLFGLKPWRARLGYGSFLTFEFGNLVKEMGHQHGEWHLWVYQCDWSLLSEGRRAVDSDARRTLIDRWVRLLEKEPLTNVKQVQPGEWAFSFGVRHRLLCRPPANNGTNDPYWYLFMPDHRVMEVGPGDRIAMEHAKPLVQQR